MKTEVTYIIDEELQEKLEKKAKEQGKSVNFIVNKILEEHENIGRNSRE